MAIGSKVSELAKGSNAELATALTRVTASVKRNKDTIKQKTEDVMGVVTSSVAGGLAGYLMGGRSAAIEKDTTLTTDEERNDAMKLFGYVEPDLAIGSFLTLMGVAGMGGKKASGTMINGGSGILAYYAGAKAYDAARTQAFKAEDTGA